MNTEPVYFMKKKVNLLDIISIWLHLHPIPNLGILWKNEKNNEEFLRNILSTLPQVVNEASPLNEMHSFKISWSLIPKKLTILSAYEDFDIWTKI